MKWLNMSVKEGLPFLFVFGLCMNFNIHSIKSIKHKLEAAKRKVANTTSQVGEKISDTAQTGWQKIKDGVSKGADYLKEEYQRQLELERHIERMEREAAELAQDEESL